MMGKLPIWMDGPNAKAFEALMVKWWEQVGLWARLPATTFDVLTCSIEFVDLIAFQRGIDRFGGESESFYRLRVHHAMRNARIAGTAKGMNQIFTNLELPTAEYQERLPEYDWDTTKVVFNGRSFAAKHVEIRFALDYYWRTCRRFSVDLRTSASTHYGPANVLSLVSRKVSAAKPATIQSRAQRSAISAANTLARRTQRSAVAKPAGVDARKVQIKIPNILGNFLSIRNKQIRSFSA